MDTFTGYLRDAVAAVLGLLILFHVGISNDQVAGILLVVTTLVAFGTYVYKSRQKTP